MTNSKFQTKEDFFDSYKYNADESLLEELGIAVNPNRKVFYLTYLRKTNFKRAKANAKAVSKFIQDQDKRIGFFACGFGWTIECLENEYDYKKIIGIDKSRYVQKNQHKDERDEIEWCIKNIGLDPNVSEGLLIFKALFASERRSRCSKKILLADIRDVYPCQSPLVLQDIKDSIGGDIEFVITERLLSTLVDDEKIIQLSSDIRKDCDSILHLVFVKHKGQKKGHNWKSLEGWKKLLPEDHFIGINDNYRVL